MTALGDMLQAVLADPGDDVARLAYADLCEEEGDAKRAEFIRVQVELATLPPGGLCGGDVIHINCPDPQRCGFLTFRYADLRRRESELMDSTSLILPESWDISNYVRWFTGDLTLMRFGPKFRRGFVESIRLILADFTEENARAVFSAHPVTKVTLTDREPSTFFGDFVEQVAGWYGYDDDRGADTLPLKLWSLLGGTQYTSRPPTWKIYPDVPAAVADFSRACVRHGRGLTGLPPLAEKEAA